MFTTPESALGAYAIELSLRVYLMILTYGGVDKLLLTFEAANLTLGVNAVLA